MTDAALPQVGDVLQGRYRLDTLLGEGGSAIVFRAWDRRDEHTVAVKVLKPGVRAFETSQRQRFERELEVLASLDDPNIVELLASGQTETGLAYAVFEFVDGIDLAELLGRGPLSPAAAVDVLRRVLIGLRSAHEAGLLHRDIKPENIRVHRIDGDSMSIKLLDFGIAKSHAESGPAVTATGELVGTPRYMSPEALTHRELTPAADIYSLGMVAYELLLGREALQGFRLEHQLERLRSGHVLASEHAQRVPGGLARILERMTARKPEERYQSADDVLGALDELDGMRLVSEHVDTFGDLETAVRDVPDIGSAAEPARQRQLSTARLVMIALGIAALAGAAAGIAVLQVVRPQEPAEPANEVERPVKLPANLLATEDPPAAAEVVSSASADVGAHDTSAARLDGCVIDPDWTGARTMAVDVGLTRLEFDVRLPADYDPARQHPVVLVFHGDHSSPELLIQQARLDKLADREGLILVGFPQAGARPWREVSMLEDVDALFARLDAELCLDRDRIFLFGHGTGSRAVEHLSCQPWVASVAYFTYLPREPGFGCSPTKPTPALYIFPLETRHIKADGSPGCGLSTATLSLAAMQQRWLTRNRCPDEPARTTKHTDGVCKRWDCAADFVSCDIDGGYGWPGTEPRAHLRDPFRCDGISADFPATDVIWDFFQSTVASETE